MPQFFMRWQHNKNFKPGFLSLGTISILSLLILCVGKVLCTVGGLAAPLVSTH